jgi:hypothetical protein
VLREVSAGAAHLFDPASVPAAAAALTAAVAEGQSPQSVADGLALRYSWPRVADLLLGALGAPGASEPGGAGAVRTGSPEVHCPPTDTDAGAIVQLTAAVSDRHTTYVVERGGDETVDWLRWTDGATTIGRAPGDRAAAVSRPGAIHHVADEERGALTYFAALGSAGLLVLHDVTFHRAWSEVVRLGLVDRSRIRAEDRIETAVPGHLAPLLVDRAVAVVFSPAAAAVVAAAAAGVRSSVQIEVLPRPMAAVAGARADGPRPLHVLRARELRRAEPARRADLLATAGYVEIAADARDGEVLEALRVGTVPVLARDYDPSGLPEGTWIRDDQLEADALSESARQEIAARGLHAVATTHSLSAWVAHLARLAELAQVRAD